MDKLIWINKIKTHRETFITIAVSAILAFLFLLNSPLHPWRYAPTATDSSVFKTVAMMMDMGYLPYRDSFDHKGPLLYAINYWGQLLSYYKGVWAFEAASITFTFLMLYKISRLKAPVFTSAIISFIAASMLFRFFDDGNLTEEYAMPFIAIGIYIFLDYLLNDKISALRIMISGISMGAVCLLRPNMIAVWIVFGLAVAYKKIVEKDWRKLSQFIFYFVLGFLIMVVPFVVWLNSIGVLADCIQDYLVFNIQYCSVPGEQNLFWAKIKSFFAFARKPVYAAALIGIFYNLKKSFFLNGVYATYMIVALLLVSMSGQTYGHYGMTLIPAVVYPLNLIAENLKNISDKKKAIIAKRCLWIFLICAILLPTSFPTIRKIHAHYGNGKYNQFEQTVKTVSTLITNLTTADESISVYGNQDVYYVWAQRKHATKYSYQFPIGQVMPKIMEEYMQQLAKELPPIIIVQEGHYDTNISHFLKNRQYTKVWPESVSDDKKSTMVFYHPKQ